MPNRKLFALLTVLLVAAIGFAAWAFLRARAVEQELAELSRAAEERAEERLRNERAVRERAAEQPTPEQPAPAMALPVAPPPRAVEDRTPPPLRLIPIDPLDPPEVEKKPGKDADPNTTTERGNRWVLRFRIREASDYLAQLRALDAEILVPVGPDGKESLLFPDLNDITKSRKATEGDLKRLKGKMQFSDNRPATVKDVAIALGMDAKSPPKKFEAYFPKRLEDELARKETSYRNRRAEDIERTYFRVRIRGGTYEVEVDEQTIKR